MVRIHKRSLPAVAGMIGLALVAAPLVAAPVAAATTGDAVVISEVYINGGSANATFSNKYVELYNPTSAAISLVGKSLQYRAAGTTTAATGNYALTGSIPAKGTYLIQGSSNGAVGAALTAPDQTTAFNPANAGGTVFLANQTTPLNPGVGSITNDPTILDIIGFGTSNTFETAASTNASVTTSLSRTATGTDTDSNAADIKAGAPTPTNSAGTVSEGGGTTPTDPPEPPAAGTPVPIADIQGSGATSPYAGQTVTARGVVTANYTTGGFAGYYIQTPGTGGDIDLSTHTKSDAIFVYSAATAASATIGSYVEVTGAVSEFSGTTEITVVAGAMTKPADTVTAPLPAAVTVPTTEAGREALEGMLIAPKGDFTVTDNYDTNFYGSVVLNPGTSPLISPTTVAEPGSAEYTAKLAENVARAITIDDGSSLSFNTNKSTPLPYLTVDKPVRIGAAVTFTKPVILEYRFSAWNFQPTQQLTADNAATVQPATFENTRTEAPEAVGGDVKLASFNVLNYFPTTGDQLTGCSYYNDRDGKPITVNTGCDARGAANAENLKRQQDKIVTAINDLNADVVSLEEIENSVRFSKDRDFALSTLVAALNAAAGAGSWSFVASPATVPASEDVIRTAFIYKSAKVKPVGTSVILDNAAFVNARQPLAQEFELASGADGSEFLAIVNHFKSKGSGTGEDADAGDGQGASNASRVKQANALVSFANTLKTERDTDRVFLLGDFNAYLKEDPIDVLTAAGYVDLGSTRTDKETYAFDGAIGSLDHIFASEGANDDVTGVDIWNINSVESIALEYSRYNYNALNLYTADQYRSSDHDPILVGLDLASDEQVVTGPAPTISGTARVGSTLTATAGEWTPSGTVLAYQWNRNGTPITGATKSSYVLTATDAGRSITVSVTGTSGDLPAVTKTSDAVAVAKGILSATPTPTIGGTVKIGKTITAYRGSWKPAPVTLKVQWKRNGVAISGATSTTYKVRSADHGKKITVTVTGSKTGYTTVSKTSAGKTAKK